MNIFVCIKQVPDTETKIKVADQKIDLAGAKWIMNPYDAHAVEEAIQLKTKISGATVYAVTVGPKARASECLVNALAMGVDEGLLVDTNEELDSSMIAKALAAAIQTVGQVQLILTGKVAIDDQQGAVSQMLAEQLKIPHVTVISKLTVDGDKSLVERDTDGGAKEIIEIQGPCVLAANKGLNTPRYPSLPGIMKAKKKVLKELQLSAMGLSSENKMRLSQYSVPPDRPAVKMLSGDPATQSQELARLLREEAKVL